MKKEKIIKIITPPVASTKIELDLVKLTEFLVKNKKPTGLVGFWVASSDMAAILKMRFLK